MRLLSILHFALQVPELKKTSTARQIFFPPFEDQSGNSLHVLRSIKTLVGEAVKHAVQHKKQGIKRREREEAKTGR